MTVPDAPWIVESERTGFSRYGWFNAPPDECDATSCDRCGSLIYLGNDYFDLDGEHLCEDCMDALERKWRRRWGE